MKRVNVFLVLAVVLSGMIGVPAPPPATASNRSETFVSFLVMHDNSFGDSLQASFNRHNADISAYDSEGMVVLGVETEDDTYRFTFGAKGYDTRLKERNYRNTSDFWHRKKHHVLDIHNEGGASCAAKGSFRVHDLRYRDGQPVRFWITYSCGSTFFGHFGEVRYNHPGDGGSLIVGPWSVRWPNVDRRWHPPLIPVTVFNPGPGRARLASARLSRDTSNAITLQRNGCTKRVLRPRKSCAVELDLDTRNAGRKTGELILEEGGGLVRRIPLHAFVLRGYTRFSFKGARGDVIVDGRERTMTFANAMIWAYGTRRGLEMSFDGKGGAWLRAEFGPLRGGRLRSGRLYRVGDGGNGYMDVYGNGVTCTTGIDGYFRIKDIVVTHGKVRRFRLKFRQRCNDGEAGVLSGEILWRYLSRPG